MPEPTTLFVKVIGNQAIGIFACRCEREAKRAKSRGVKRSGRHSSRNHTSPLERPSNPMSVLPKVVAPEPLSPTRPNISRGAISSDTRSTARCVTPPAYITTTSSAICTTSARSAAGPQGSYGTTHVVLEPLDLMARLAALVPRPRLNLTRFHGVFAPNCKHRRSLAPKRKPGAEKPETPLAPMSWTQRLRRVFAIDIETRPKCGGKLKVIGQRKRYRSLANGMFWLRESGRIIARAAWGTWGNHRHTRRSNVAVGFVSCKIRVNG